MKKYTVSVVYRGQQITKMACAKNTKDASKLLNVNTYFIDKYGYKTKIDEPFEGVIACFDSGMLWRERKDLIRVEMPLQILLAIIDSYKDNDYEIFKKQMGI